MATSPTTKSATTSGAAKDDVLGADGTFTFSISDLLGNDPGGAAKVDVTTQFFFGDTAADQTNQVQYLIDHGIVNNGDGTYTITGNASDFNYFVQIGNKGTWSTAHVDVTAPEAHLGGRLFTENFDGYAETQQYFDPPGNFVFGTTDLNSANDWTNASYVELGADGYGTIDSTSGDAWLDTQNSPGPINMSHEFTDTTAAVGGTTSVLSFDIAKQSLDYLGTHYETDPNASFEFRIDGQMVAQFDAADFAQFNQMQHFDIDIAPYADNSDNIHTLELVDTSGVSGFTGFAVDSIQINDWFI